jgi:major cell surface glycoprotein (TIGR04216 family)
VNSRYGIIYLLVIVVIAGSAGLTAVDIHTVQHSEKSLGHSNAAMPTDTSWITRDQTQTNSPTPSPRSSANESTPQRENLSVSGSISNPTPPGNTRITTTIKLQFDSPIVNGTTIEFNKTYTPDNIQIQSVQTRTENATGSVTGDVTESIINNESHPEIRLTTTGDIQAVRLILAIEHSERQADADTIYQINVRPPETNGGVKTTVASYSVRPIGDDRRSGRTGEFDRATGSGFIYSNATVYQGEADIEFRGALRPPLRGISGDAEGYLLAPPIAGDIPTGIYSSDGTNQTATVRVQTPKINTLRVENSEDIDVSGGIVYPETTDTLKVTAQSNFEDAEEIELTVRNADNLDITNEVIDTARARPETPGGNPPVQANLEPSMTASLMDADHLAESDNGFSKTIIQRSELSQSPHMGSETNINDSITAQTTGSATSQRSINQSEVDPGGSVKVTLTGKVGANGRITFAETFSPEVSNAKINSVTSSTGSIIPIVSIATEERVTVSAGDLPSGETITVTYTIQVGPSDETYLIEGSVTALNRNIEYADTQFIAGSGGNTEVTSDGKVTWGIDLDTIETSSISISVSGVDDLVDKQATASADVAISHESASITPETRQPIQGQNLKLSVNHAAYGSNYLVVIPIDDLRSTLTKDAYNNVFRSVGTTRAKGIITQSGDQIVGTIPEESNPAAVFAELRSDPDSGVGTTEVRTQTLAEDSEINVALLYQNDPADFVTTGHSADNIDISVADPSVELTGPDTYRTQSETTIKGSITPGVDTVIMYVETNSGFEQVDLDSQVDQKVAGTAVSGESFSHDVRLSHGDGPGNEIISIPGTYNVALRAKTSLPSDNNEEVPTTISKPEILTGTIGLQTLVVQDTAITLDSPGLNGSIATTEPFVRLDGTAKGRETALIVGIGDRGSVETVQVDGPNFSDVNLPINTFANGNVRIYALSAGRDGQIGDGEIEIDSNRSGTSSVSSIDGFQRYIETIAGTDATSEQLQAIVRNETEFDTGSDDVVVTRELLVTTPRIVIQTPASGQSITGDTIQVRGTTNIRPQDSRIEVSLKKRGNVTTDVRTSQWKTASWNATISVPPNASGQYALTADVDGTKTAHRITVAQSGKNTIQSVSVNNNNTPVSSTSTSTNINTDIQRRGSNITTESVTNGGTPARKSNNGINSNADVNTSAGANVEQLWLSQFGWVATVLIIGCIIFWLRL